MLVVDFGFAFNTQLRLISAAAAGAAIHPEKRSVPDVVQLLRLRDLGHLGGDDGLRLEPAPTVTVKINNTTDGSGAGKYYCVSGSPPSWTQVSSSSSSCASNLYGGQYVTLTVSTTLTNIFPTDPIVSSVFPLQETIIVRVQ